ncbi:N-formylglutamate amidohydrolase [Maricaulis sp.]|uniref:N-formylglutamate amidohydrolase n=1 Tax=Maricaulis sp. TaxID=1486257 RepID=UPI0025B7BCEA|nr:N-formylglutamate amidohydrolase [Maricaulis sp.]
MAPTANADIDPGPVSVVRPAGGQAYPIVASSPHSGRNYRGEFENLTHHELGVLRRSEDAYVDQLIEGIPELGIPTVAANFPRVFVDVNRAAGELDPGMYSDRVRAELIRDSRRTASGLGVIPRISADGRPLYGRRLKFAEAERRLKRCYWPYHDALTALVDETRTRFGAAVLLDVHSMPHQSARGADIVLGDRFGQSCDPRVSDLIEARFREQGFVTVRNTPYAGGHTTASYGRPESGVHAIQIEVNRSLYLDENRVQPTAGLDRLRGEFCQLISVIREPLTACLPTS